MPIGSSDFEAFYAPLFRGMHQLFFLFAHRNIEHLDKLQKANLDQAVILDEIKKRGPAGKYLTLVLLQLHAAGVLTENTKKSLMHYKFETLEKCAIAITAFYAASAFTKAKKAKLMNHFQNEHFYLLIEFLLKNQLLFVPSLNVLMRIDPTFFETYASIFKTLDTHGVLSKAIIEKLFSLTLPMLRVFNEAIARMSMNHSDTHDRIMRLLSTPWLLSEDAENAIWSRASDHLTDVEFDEIIRCAGVPQVDNREPNAADFRDAVTHRVSLPFIFFVPKPKIGENERCLKPYESELPEHFFCALSFIPMTNPVRIVGITPRVYEKEMIMKWIMGERPVDPFTNLALPLLDKEFIDLTEDKECAFVPVKGGYVILQPALDVIEEINAFKRSKGIVVEKSEFNAFAGSSV